ncbi:MAG: hypothetical protein ABW292_00560 [Vicinamibacterales bacterium]
MQLLKQLVPVVAVSLVPAVLYAAVNDLSRVISDTEATFIAWTALALGAVLAWRAMDEYLVERDASVEAMKRFGQMFVSEFERPLRQSNGSDRPIESQLRASPDRGRLEILLSPGGGHRYPNLSDHRTNVLYDVTRVLKVLHDERFVCEQVYSKGPWVVVPFQFLSAKQAGGR